MTGVALGGFSSCQRQQESALKPIDKAALQAMVDTTAKELLIPGAVVVLRTPQGEFTVSYGTTLLGATSPPARRYPLPDRLQYQDDDGCGDCAACPGRQAQTRRSSLEVRPGRAQRRQHHHHRTVEYAQWSLHLRRRPRVLGDLERDPTKVWSPAEVLAIAFTHPPYFPPGTGFHYSNTNYALLGLIAEKIDGKPLASCLQDRLFGPLGLKDTLLAAITSNTLPEPYSHGYLYGGCSFRNLTGKPYPPDIQAAVKAGTLKPDDCTGQNSSYASAAGGVISTANDLAIWIKALVGGKVLNADYQRQWLDSLQPEDPGKPEGQKYGYGISQISWGPNTIYFHGGEMPGFNSKIGYDPTNKLTLIIWTNLTVSLDEQQTANTLCGEDARSRLQSVAASISAGLNARASNSPT